MSLLLNPKAAPVAAGAATTIGVLGTSLVQQNDAATASKISHWNRGWLSWARYFAKGRFSCEIWHDPAVYLGWEPSQAPGATRFFRGLNAGVSGQTIALIEARKQFLKSAVDCGWVVIDAGTNDMATLAKEAIHAARVELAHYYLAAGISVIMLPILARGTGSWAAGSAERKKAAWVNNQTIQFCKATPDCYYFDWNAYWVDFTNANGEPKAGFSPDFIHFQCPGGVSVGEGFANFAAKLLPEAFPRVWSADDLFDATHNPSGNLLPNPFCAGTGGANGTGSSGSVSSSMRVERSTGDATVVCSKETRADGRGDYQVLTCTPGATDSLIYFRTNSADTTHTYPAGTWVQASCECEIGPANGWQGVSLYLKDNGIGGLIAYDLEPFDPGSGYVKLPMRQLNGMLVTPPIQLVNASPSLRWRVELRVGSTGGGASGNHVVKLGAVELRQVADPRGLVGYKE